MQTIIGGSVGANGANVRGDVRLVQRLINDVRARKNLRPLLVVDGIAGQKTNAAISQYQSDCGLITDGRIDPTGPTIKRLIQDHLASLQASVIKPPLNPHFNLTDPNVSAVASPILRAYFEALRS
jgi:peptidoglycan hydrolase-like protein with peptidoglycan-binding domain